MVEQVGDALAGLPRHPQHVAGFAADDVGDLGGVAVRVGGRQVDLVQYRDDCEVAIQRQVQVGQRLRLDALRGVDQQHRALARLQRPRHLVGEVDVARGVDQMQDVICRSPDIPRQPHVLRLDRDAAFAFDVHPVQVLRTHRAFVDHAGQLQHPVGQRRLAVVDVGDDAEVPNLRRRGERLVGEAADGNLLVKGAYGLRSQGIEAAPASRTQSSTLAALTYARVHGSAVEDVAARLGKAAENLVFNEAPKFIRQLQNSATLQRGISAGHQVGLDALTGSSARGTAITAGRPVTENSVPTAHRARKIVYAPDLDGRADPGEIVWTWVVYEDDPSKGKDRPVLVVGRDRSTLLGSDAVQPGTPRATTATGSASAAAAGITRAGRAGCGWTACSTCPRKAFGAKARFSARETFEKIAARLRAEYSWS